MTREAEWDDEDLQAFRTALTHLQQHVKRPMDEVAWLWVFRYATEIRDLAASHIPPGVK